MRAVRPPPHERVFQARLLAADPFIAIGATTPETPMGPAPYVAAQVGDRRCLWLIAMHWSLEASDLRERIVATYRPFAAAYPRHQVLYLCNTERELELLDAAGVPAMHCNHNILVNERLYAPDPTQPKDYDAVYTARMLRYKRHALGSAIARLALIYYDLESAEPGYFAEVRAALPNAVFVNEALAREGYGRLANPRAQALAAQLIAARSYVGLRPEKVAEIINRARVGLCLSAAEGAMYASMEYLMCGVPVVSTVNAGGRDVFFDPDYCRTVEPDPEAIRAAVTELAHCAAPAATIRARTVARVEAMRAALRARVAALVADRAPAERLDAAWAALSTGRWWRWCTVAELTSAAAAAE
jgi:glycosyltransferase involved in cell wall biosynthesis